MSRPPRIRRSVVAAALVALLGIFLAGCGTGPDPAATDSTPSASDSFPVTIEHALGSAVIEQRPTRIFAIAEDLDALVAIGVKPVGYMPMVPGVTDVPYLKGLDLSEAEVVARGAGGELDVEKIAALRPDLILGSNYAGMESAYEQLSQIAPTVAYEKGWGETSWQDMTRTIGRAVGEEEAAAAAVARSEQRIADVRAELPGLKGRTLASVNYFEEGRFATNPRSASMDLFLALGMQVQPEILDAKPEGIKDNTLSLEQIELLDADYLQVGYASDDLRTSLEANPLYRNLGVVKRDLVHAVPPADKLELHAGNSPSVLNVPWVLDEVRDDLARVAEMT